MELSVQALSGEARALEVADGVFAQDYRPGLIHQVVIGYMAAARSGTKAQKSRADVSGGGSKPWRQKGTGRARAGTTRGPLWRGGGVTFAATPRSYEQKVNKKMYRGAMRSIVSELVRQERIRLVEQIPVAEAKTKVLAKYLREQGLEKVLILVDELDMNLMLAARNLPNVDVQEAAWVDPVSLVGFEQILATESAIKRLEERLS